MKTISFKLVGVSPLMLNNPRTVSPFDDYAKARDVFANLK